MNRAHIFLRCYAETGSVTRAAAAAKIHRSIHYRRMGADEKYKAAFQAAQRIAVEVLEDEAVRRAVEGVDEPVVFQGAFSYPSGRDEKTGQYIAPSKSPLAIRKYSDSLLQFLLRGAKPEKYRERHQHDVTANINVTKFKGSLEDLLATYRNLIATENDQEAA